MISSTRSGAITSASIGNRTSADGADSRDRRPLKANGADSNYRRDGVRDPRHFPIIAHCHLRWDFVWQRPQQVFSRLAAHHPVLFVEEPVFDNCEPFLKLSEPHAGVLRAIPVLSEGLKSSIDGQCAAILPFVRDALEQHPLFAGHCAPPVQWFYSPMTAPAFLDGIGSAAVVYDCMDELANFRFAPPDIRRREEFLLSRANVMFTGGYQLYQAKSRHHANVHFFGCGVDVAHYARARQAETLVPPELADLPRPVFGYFGVIDERLDYELLAALARRFPHASIVMVGPLAKVERHQLPQCANIHWLGQRAYADLPAILKGFDVCLMPFALNEATQYINPTKTLEYMAAGKPVVSTAVPDVVHHFQPIVEVAHSHEEFACAVERGYHAPRAGMLAEGIDRANRASWEAIVSGMREHVITAVSGGGGNSLGARRTGVPGNSFCLNTDSKRRMAKEEEDLQQPTEDS